MGQRPYCYAGALVLMAALTGCPMTDDYYLLPRNAEGGAQAKGGKGGDGEQSEAGRPAQAGSITGGGVAGSESPSGVGGAPDAGQAGQTGDAGGAEAEPCFATTERCNGHDDDCDDLVDELACQTSCSGFTLVGDPSHGYMFCTGARKLDWDNAKRTCEDQDMRLAWLDSAEENAAVAQKFLDLGTDVEVLFGATDHGNEGDWLWFGGDQFWRGNAWQGYPINGRFNAWAPQTPNDGNNNEDCALLNATSRQWGDRTCDATYPFVCEQPD